LDPHDLAIANETRDRIRTYIAADFSARRMLNESPERSATREPPMPIAKTTVPVTVDAPKRNGD